jgi:hypothetical protein
VDIAIASSKRSLHGGFADIIEIPRQFQEKATGNKKTRVATPSRAKSPAKRRFPVHQTSPGCTERISKRWQMGGKIARPGAKR